MPVSKGRKKKKKSVKSAKSKAKVEPDEVYEQEGLRLERRGKMTYLQNTRTGEQHQAYLDSLPDARKYGSQHKGGYRCDCRLF